MILTLRLLLVAAVASIHPIEGEPRVPAEASWFDRALVSAAPEASDVAQAASADSSEVVRTRRSLPARIGGAARNLGSDAWLVVSSPARINRHGAVRLAVVLAAGGVLYTYDEELLEASIRNWEDPTWSALQDVGSFVEPAGFMGQTIPIYLAVAGAGYLFDVRPMREIPVQIIESHLISGALRNSIKTFVGRSRPNENNGPYHFEFSKGNSFPSGHTSVMFEAATVLAHHAHSTPVAVLLYTLAGAGALERVHSRNHWPSDLILSAVSGTLIARTVVRRHEERTAGLKTGFFIEDDGTLRLGVSLPLGQP